MTDVGERLRHERVRQGLDLAAVSKITRIRERYLAAIEDNRIEEVPGYFFYKSFVRQYAAALGMDRREFQNELDRVEMPEVIPGFESKRNEFPLKPLDPIVEESNRRYVGSGRIWTPVVLLAVVVAGCSGVYAWWRHHETAALVRPAPARPVATVQRKAPAERHESAAAVQSAATPKMAASSARTLPSTVDRVPDTPVADSDPGTPPVPRETVQNDARIVLNVAAKDEVWLSISSEGKRVFSGILEPSESKVVGGKDPFRIRVGNAGAIEITWNGKPIGPIGEKGQVRDVVFTPDKYQILTPGGSL